MPAYFSMNLEFSRAELDYDNMKELEHYLRYAGLEFIDGTWEAEGQSLEEIMNWNQKKLEENFVLGDEEAHENDYRQMLFKYGDFSEIRGYISNNYPAEKEYSFTLLIPEEEVAVDSFTYDKKAVKKLRELADILWILPKVRTVQTELELSEGLVSEEEIKNGAVPSAFPFAIVSEKQFGKMDDSCYVTEHINAGGVVLMPKKIKLV